MDDIYLMAEFSNSMVHELMIKKLNNISPE